MNCREVRTVNWRLRLKLAAVVLLGAAALLVSPPQVASAPNCPHRICLRDVSVSSCCNGFLTGSDSIGPCRRIVRCP